VEHYSLFAPELGPELGSEFVSGFIFGLTDNDIGWAPCGPVPIPN
jgi:hypothetical protein